MERTMHQKSKECLGTAVMAHKVRLPVGTGTGNDGNKLSFLNTW